MIRFFRRQCVAVVAVGVVAVGVLGAVPAGAQGSEVSISGSSTVEPITSLTAELFAEEQPDAAIRVDGPGTGDGFELFCQGETDASDASRPIEDEDPKHRCARPTASSTPSSRSASTASPWW